MLGDAAVVGVEVAVVPLVAGVFASAFAIGPAVVHAHGYQVLPLPGVRGEVHAEGHDAVLVQSDMLSVEVDVRSLPCAFEFDEHLAFQVLL